MGLMGARKESSVIDSLLVKNYWETTKEGSYSHKVKHLSLLISKMEHFWVWMGLMGENGIWR